MRPMTIRRRQSCKSRVFWRWVRWKLVILNDISGRSDHFCTWQSSKIYRRIELLGENVNFCSKKSALTHIKSNVISDALENCFHFQSIRPPVLSLSLYLLWSVLSALNFEYLSSFPPTFPCNRRSVLTAPWLSDKNRFILLSFWTSSKIWRKMWTYVTYRVPCFLWRWNTVHNGNYSATILSCIMHMKHHVNEPFSHKERKMWPMPCWLDAKELSTYYRSGNPPTYAFMKISSGNLGVIIPDEAVKSSTKSDAIGASLGGSWFRLRTQPRSEWHGGVECLAKATDGRTVAPREHLSLSPSLSPLGSNNWFCDVNGGRFLAYGLTLPPPLFLTRLRQFILQINMGWDKTRKYYFNLYCIFPLIFYPSFD